jgi:hypothetical protein
MTRCSRALEGADAAPDGRIVAVRVRQRPRWAILVPRNVDVDPETDRSAWKASWKLAGEGLDR